MSQGQQHAIEDDQRLEVVVLLPFLHSWSSLIACCWPWFISLIYEPGLLFRGLLCTWCIHTFIYIILWHLIRYQGDNARRRSVEGHGRSPFECIALYQRLCVWTEKTTNKVRTAEISCKIERRAWILHKPTRYEVLTAALMKILAYGDVTVRRLVQSFHVPERHGASST